MSVIKTRNKEIKAFSAEQLAGDLESEIFQYQQTRFEASVKGLRSPNELKEMRRDIARIQTELRQRELANLSADELAQRSRLRARRRKK